LALSAISIDTEIILEVLGGVRAGSPCQQDLDALNKAAAKVPGTTPIDNLSLAGEVAQMKPQDGMTASALASTLNDPKINAVPTVANAPISKQFTSSNGSLGAEAQLGGHNVYFNPALVLNSSIESLAGLITHEVLHNMGLNGPQIESALGLTSTQCPNNSTACIGVKLEEDCFQPKMVKVLGLP